MLLFEASGISNKLKKYKKYYDTTKIKYMPDTPRDAVGGGKYKTVAEYINADWELPYYEPQKTCGCVYCRYCAGLLIIFCINT